MGWKKYLPINNSLHSKITFINDRNIKIFSDKNGERVTIHTKILNRRKFKEYISRREKLAIGKAIKFKKNS